MGSVSVQEIQADPQAFVRRVEGGEPLQITCGGRVLAEVRPAAPAASRRPRAQADGEFAFPAEFGDPLPGEVIAGFEVR